MSDVGFGNAKKKEDGKAVVNVDQDEYNKLIKEYKKLKKFQKSNMYEISKLSGKETELDRLLAMYGEDGNI